MTLPRTVIAYCPASLAPHQGMFIRYLQRQLGTGHDVILREIPTRTVWRVVFALRVVADALLRRGSLLYFCSFLSCSFAIIPIVLRHRKWMYHSQDWISHYASLSAKLEKVVVRRAPLVIWNERNRAQKAKALSKRRGDILVLPTYLPIDYEVPKGSVQIRNDLAARVGADVDELIIVFAGGGYSPDRLSDQLLDAVSRVSPNVIFVFTGASRVPEHRQHRNVVDMGLLSFADMMAVMASSDIGLLLYDYSQSFGHRHQQPGRLTEYLRGGLAIVATPFPDAERLAAETPFCMTVAGYDADELGDAMGQMAKRIVEGRVSPSKIRDYAKTRMAYEPFAATILSAIQEAF